MQNLSYEIEFDLHENELLSGTDHFRTKTRFDTEAATQLENRPISVH